MNRAEFHSLVMQHKKILEIGPFTSPFISGENVKYFDRLDHEELVKRAQAHKLEIKNCPKKIHYVSQNCDYTIIHESFDAIFSSHCIEHTPDFISHICDISNILLDNGIYYLIIPDKRFCFDAYLTPSTIPQILSAYYEKRKIHTLENIIEHRVFTAKVNPSDLWNLNYNNSDKCIINEKNFIDKCFDEFLQKKYVDVHAWKFTPKHFRDILLYLYHNNYINLYPVKIFPTEFGNIEFFAILQKSNIKINAQLSLYSIYKNMNSIDEIEKTVINELKYSYENSSSWKLTKPLRDISKIGKKIKRFFNRNSQA